MQNSAMCVLSPILVGENNANIQTILLVKKSASRWIRIVFGGNFINTHTLLSSHTCISIFFYLRVFTSSTIYCRVPASLTLFPKQMKRKYEDHNNLRHEENKCLSAAPFKSLICILSIFFRIPSSKKLVSSLQMRLVSNQLFCS